LAITNPQVVGNMGDIRVVLADDHPVVRAGLAALLGSLPGIEVVALGADGHAAVKEVVLYRPDVAVLDLTAEPAASLIR
jgi:DNA-binding NarL/FixJ family response regulator